MIGKGDGRCKFYRRDQGPRPSCSYTTTRGRGRDGTLCGVRRLREKQEVVIVIGEVEGGVDADLTCPGFEVLKRWCSTTT